MTRPFCWFQVQGHLSRSNIKVTVLKKKKKNGRCGSIGVPKTLFSGGGGGTG